MEPYSTEITLENACRNFFHDLDHGVWERKLQRQGSLPDFCLAYESIPFEQAYQLIETCLKDKLAKTEEFHNPIFLKPYDLTEVTYEKTFAEQNQLVSQFITKNKLSQFDFDTYKMKSRRDGIRSKKDYVDLLNCTVFNLILAKKLHESDHPEAFRLLLSVCRQHRLSSESYCITYESYEEEKQSKRQARNTELRSQLHYSFQGVVAAYMMIYMPQGESPSNAGWKSVYKLTRTLKPKLAKFLETTTHDFSMFSEDNLERRIKEWIKESPELKHAYQMTSKPFEMLQYFNQRVEFLSTNGPDQLWSSLRSEVYLNDDDDDDENLELDDNPEYGDGVHDEFSEFEFEEEDVNLGMEWMLFCDNLEKLNAYRETLDNAQNPEDPPFLNIVSKWRPEHLIQAFLSD